MINNILCEQVSRYGNSSLNVIKNSLKEVLQEIALCGLAKSGFFKIAAFYGGTSLRIFRDLSRFSEDLDFTLIKNIDNFDFDYYLSFVKKEFDSMDINCDIYSKQKNLDTTVESRYIRFNLKELIHDNYPKFEDKIINNELLTIKIEVEKTIIDGGKTEIKLLTYPSFAQVQTFTIETLFASKLIAILNRNWKNIIKGRDYYDYLFYIHNNVKVNMTFLKNGLKKFNYINDESYNISDLKADLKNKFETIDFDVALKDVLPFVNSNDLFIQSFNKDIFVASTNLIKEE